MRKSNPHTYGMDVAFDLECVTKASGQCMSSLERLGKSLLTFSYSCAAMNGISPSIVDRANELASLAARGENLVAACAVVSTEEMKALNEAV